MILFQYLLSVGASSDTTMARARRNLKKVVGSMLGKFLQQPPSLLQVFRVKPFGEPVVDLG